MCPWNQRFRQTSRFLILLWVQSVFPLWTYCTCAAEEDKLSFLSGRNHLERLITWKLETATRWQHWLKDGWTEPDGWPWTNPSRKWPFYLSEAPLIGWGDQQGRRQRSQRGRLTPGIRRFGEGKERSYMQCRQELRRSKRWTIHPSYPPSRPQSLGLSLAKTQGPLHFALLIVFISSSFIFFTLLDTGRDTESFYRARRLDLWIVPVRVLKLHGRFFSSHFLVFRFFFSSFFISLPLLSLFLSCLLHLIKYNNKEELSSSEVDV